MGPGNAGNAGRSHSQQMHLQAVTAQISQIYTIGSKRPCIEVGANQRGKSESNTSLPKKQARRIMRDPIYVHIGTDVETDIGSFTPFYEGTRHGMPRLLDLFNKKDIR